MNYHLESRCSRESAERLLNSLKEHGCHKLLQMIGNLPRRDIARDIAPKVKRQPSKVTEEMKAFILARQGLRTHLVVGLVEDTFGIPISAATISRIWLNHDAEVARAKFKQHRASRSLFGG